VKLPDSVELLARVRYHSAAYRRGIERDAAYLLLMVSQQQLALANFELQKLSCQDSLTGVANRSEFDKRMESESGRGIRSQAPMCLLLCDVDHFKTLNETYGHTNGDVCL
jgi:two-component system chemotaxis family response regulator WspR